MALLEFVVSNKNNISVAVGSKYGLRSSNWIVSVSGHDVYVTTAKCKKQWKVSLHKSGRWHMKNLKTPNSLNIAPLIKTHVKGVPKGNYAVGLYIVVPDSCLRAASAPDKKSGPNKTSAPDNWIDRPSEGGVVEIAVMKWKVQEVKEEWPGKSAGTQLRFAYPITEDKMEVVGILTRHLGKSHPEAILMNQNVDNHVGKFKPIVLDSPERRGYIFGQNKVGSIVITEYAID